MGNRNTTTLDNHFDYLGQKVTGSHVSRYGDVSFKDDMIGEYMGYSDTYTTNTTPSSSSQTANSHIKQDSPDNELLFRRYKAKTTSGAEKKKWEAAVEEEVALRAQVDNYVTRLTKKHKHFKRVSHVKNMECYKKGINQLIEAVGHSDYSLKYYDVIANMCNEDKKAFEQSVRCDPSVFVCFIIVL